MKWLLPGLVIGFIAGVALESWMQDWEPEQEELDAKVATEKY